MNLWLGVGGLLCLGAFLWRTGRRWWNGEWSVWVAEDEERVSVGIDFVELRRHGVELWGGTAVRELLDGEMMEEARTEKR